MMLLQSVRSAREAARPAEEVVKTGSTTPEDLAEHVCRVPWFVITSPVEDAEEVRDLLNR